MLAAIPVSEWISQNPSLALAGAIVFVGLFGIGLKDLLRFSAGRTAAIGSVNFRQAIRRRVLWITPLLMLGIIIVNQFQRPLDPQDAMRQATMVCLFATGLLVTMLIIILASTSLPREIESRVIYTVATKPATRLEMILGKVFGFASVSFWILLIMGLFTWGYLSFRDWQMRKTLAAQLETPNLVTDSLRPTYEYYRDKGTLHARTFGLPQSLNIYSHLPTSPDDRWSPGGDEGEMLVRFTIDRTLIPPAPASEAAPSPLVVGPAAAPQPALLLRIPIKVRKQSPAANASVQQAPTTTPAQPLPPRVGINLSDANQNVFLSSAELGAQDGWELSEPGGVVVVSIQHKHLDRLLGDAPQGDIDLSIIGYDAEYEYSTSADDILAIIPQTGTAFTSISDVHFLGRSGQYGQQLRGGSTTAPRVAVFRFADQQPEGPPRDQYAFEIRMGVERVEEEVQAKVVVDFYNRTTGKRVGNIETMVETNRPSYIDVPAEAIEGGNFDVVMTTYSDVWLGLQIGPRASIKLIKEDQGFAWNLFKSLTVLWLLSLLVVIIAVFCSTFLSWPIAVILTIVILMGHWAAQQVGDIAQAGIGRQIVTQMLSDADAASAKAVSQSVDALVSMLHTVSAVLPDISKYSALHDIQQGLAVSAAGVLLPSLMVTLGFGLPLTVLAYVFLKYKEVAP